MFDLVAPYAPAGDQPQAIDALTAGIRSGAKHQVKRVDAGGSFLLFEPLHPAGILHRLDGGMVVLCIVADAQPGNTRRRIRRDCFPVQAMVRGHFGGFPFVGQPAVSEHLDAAVVVWLVHPVSGGVEYRRRQACVL